MAGEDFEYLAIVNPLVDWNGFPVSQDERNEKEKLIDELTQKDKEWNRREQTLSLQYKKEINDLKQKVFVLESRVKDVDDKKRQSKASNLKVSYKSKCA